MINPKNYHTKKLHAFKVWDFTFNFTIKQSKEQDATHTIGTLSLSSFPRKTLPYWQILFIRLSSKTVDQATMELCTAL
ncbi:hypothetical protein LNTAR_23499 [Lentisphaera araneosa HTCC2155]|jgi:hypothetical protein|uniref:Uncharacterized protein n=1 Tax=Lentisphaera araneosa HTCC2155 TaxID=313628 RepID=A6DGU1_9BACT|nr:hypothetical protein LNTAR_23499 [Lentisphaera araneosa HTCC2155]